MSMSGRDRELLDLAKHAQRKIEHAIQDAGQLCDSDYERWQMICALQVHLMRRLAVELSAISPIMASWPEEIRLFAAATFAVQMVMPAQSTPRTLTPETLERSWKQIVKAVGKLEGAPRG